MAHRRRKDQYTIAALDIGASKIACFIARVAHEPDLPPQAEIIGVGCHGAAVKQREAACPEQLEANIRKAVAAAERMANIRIDRVLVAVPGKMLHTRRIGVDLDIADGVVTQEDIEDCLQEGARLTAPPECRALHAVATAYRLDGEEVFNHPAGLNGAMLSTEMLGVAAPQSTLDNLSTLVERCSLTPDEFVAAPAAAAEATLIEDEKDLGVILIDIGGQSTGYAVYDNGALVDCGGVGVGGGHITKDIAQIFNTPLGQAERIKTLYGAALIGPGDEHRLVDFPQLGPGSDHARASRADLCEVIIPRMEEIFELVLARQSSDPLHRTGLRRAVVTGGGGLLVGAREIAEKVLSMKARLGRPIAIPGAPDAAAAPGFAVCAGVIQCYINSAGGDQFALGVAGQSPHGLSQSAFLGGVEAWLRQKF